MGILPETVVGVHQGDHHVAVFYDQDVHVIAAAVKTAETQGMDSPDR